MINQKHVSIIFSNDITQETDYIKTNNTDLETFSGVVVTKNMGIMSHEKYNILQIISKIERGDYKKTCG